LTEGRQKDTTDENNYEKAVWVPNARYRNNVLDKKQKKT